MDSLASRARATSRILAGLLLIGTSGAGEPARAQGARPAERATADPGGGTAVPPGPRAGRRDANPSGANARTPAPGQGRLSAREPSPARREALRQTLEKRRQRRARRALGQGLDDSRPVGAIVPWPMPPALIIRHTPPVHGEVGGLLELLRR
jgi:hypothetical protein